VRNGITHGWDGKKRLENRSRKPVKNVDRSLDAKISAIGALALQGHNWYAE
jgi:hypothetical protein